jgi:hypothetical protein
MHRVPPIGRIRRRAASAAGIIAALAIAAPIGEASAAAPAIPALPALPALRGFGALPAFTPVPLSFVGPAVGAVGVAIGPTVIGSVFNGGTTVCTSTVASACSTNASP